MVCVSTPSFSLSINGSLCGFFQREKRAEVGGPISRLLFLIAMEYCSRLISKMSKKEGFEYHYRCSALKLTHLIFYR